MYRSGKGTLGQHSLQLLRSSMATVQTSLKQESRDRYLTYALSVVSGRALPDVRDGLKPVQRRILYAMLNNLNLKPSNSHRKSAAVVGEVLARFHPHGDVACYEAMVRMAQNFSLRYPLVDGQGNFGSLDGDNAAAYRYTEARLRELALEVIGEIDQETVPFRDNFDATVVEPVVLPSRVPNLLVNGATGIAVGMATSIPPHNLKDTIKALVELSKDPELTTSKLVGSIKAPDFPTGCSILNTHKELVEMYETGRGSVRMRGDWQVEEQGRGKQSIVVSTIPYAVNKSTLVERIAGLIIDRKVPQLVDVRDESTDEVRIVLELAPGADAEVAMAYLFKNTPLESNFPVNLTALVPAGGASTRPELLSLKSCLQHFLTFRAEVTEKRLVFERKQLLDRIHILEGLALVYDALDEALRIVRKSDGRTDAAEKLRERFKLTEIQSFAVVDMRIYQLSRTNIDEIRKELAEKGKRVREIDGILKSKDAINQIVRDDLEALSAKFGDRRRSKLIKDNVDIEFDETQYVVQEDVHAIVTTDGWVKRIRRTNDLASTRLREGDALLSAHALTTLDSVALFTNFGTLFVLKVSDFPASSGYGTPIQKILKFKDGEKIVSSFGVSASASTAAPSFSAQSQLPLGGAEGSAVSEGRLSDGETVVLIGHQGTGLGLTLTELTQTKRSGRRVMKLREGEYMAAVAPIAPLILFATRSGSALAIAKGEVPVRDSAAVGVALMGVREDDAVVACCGVKSGKLKGTLLLDLKSGKTKEVPLSEVTKGHRALKGTKVYSREEIVGAKVVE
jgi:DNA gyrase subunit A